MSSCDSKYFNKCIMRIKNLSNKSSINRISIKFQLQRNVSFLWKLFKIPHTTCMFAEVSCKPIKYTKNKSNNLKIICLWSEVQIENFN